MEQMMTGLVSAPPPNDDEDLDTVLGDAFWPALSIEQARKVLRIPETVALERVRDSLYGGVIATRAQLVDWKAGHVADGRESLADVTSETVGGESIAEVLYRRAVFAFAGADLAETHHDLSATNDGTERAGDRALAADDHRRNAIHAVRDLLGVTRTAVELI